MSTKVKKIFSFLFCLLLLFQQAGFAQVAAELNIAGHLAILHNSFASDTFRPLHLRYLSFNPLDNSFKLLLDKGSLNNPTDQEIQDSSKTLMQYFLVGLTLPNDTFWVNLRPDSPDRIIDDRLAKTDIGKIMLETDLQLKKDTASFTSPRTPEGKEYWDKLYKKAEELYGYENVTIPTLTRPWIVPGEIIIRETTDSAYIYKATLKVMLEQDYLKNAPSAINSGTVDYSFKDEHSKALNEYSTQLIRELIIPKLTKEINSSKRYASLRQVYYSLIMAQWFKTRDKKELSPKGSVSDLIDKQDLTNLVSKQSWSKTTYFEAYKKSFTEGEYNIQESHYTPTGQVIRSYFSGGTVLSACSGIIIPGKGSSPVELKSNYLSVPAPSKYNTVVSGSPVINDQIIIEAYEKLDNGIPLAPKLFRYLRNIFRVADLVQPGVVEEGIRRDPDFVYKSLQIARDNEVKKIVPENQATPNKEQLRAIKVAQECLQSFLAPIIPFVAFKTYFLKKDVFPYAGGEYLCFVHAVALNSRLEKFQLADCFVHEGLHAHSIGFDQVILDEGMTKYLEKKIATEYYPDSARMIRELMEALSRLTGEENEENVYMTYANKIIESIAVKVGIEPLYQAYFYGDHSLLKTSIGEDEWQKICSLCDAFNFNHSERDSVPESELKRLLREVQETLKGIKRQDYNTTASTNGPVLQAAVSLAKKQPPAAGSAVKKQSSASSPIEPWENLIVGGLLPETEESNFYSIRMLHSNISKNTLIFLDSRLKKANLHDLTEGKDIVLLGGTLDEFEVVAKRCSPLAEKFHIVNIDTYKIKQMAKSAYDKMREIAPEKFAFYNRDISDLKDIIPDNSMGLAVNIGVLEFIDGVKAVESIKEMVRILMPGGIGIVQDLHDTEDRDLRKSLPDNIEFVTEDWAKGMFIFRKKVETSSPLGGIDFRFLPIVSQAVANLSANLRDSLLRGQSLQRINLGEEWRAIEQMSSSGIKPSPERIREYAQASSALDRISQDKDGIILCIADILRQEEEQNCETDPLLRDILVVLESVQQPQELKEAFLGKV